MMRECICVWGGAYVRWGGQERVKVVLAVVGVLEQWQIKSQNVWLNLRSLFELRCCKKQHHLEQPYVFRIDVERDEKNAKTYEKLMISSSISSSTNNKKYLAMQPLVKTRFLCQGYFHIIFFLFFFKDFYQ